jgi:hypothetical protein
MALNFLDKTGLSHLVEKFKQLIENLSDDTTQAIDSLNNQLDDVVDKVDNKVDRDGDTISGDMQCNAQIIFGKSDDYGIRTSSNSWGRIGESAKRFYESHINNMYGANLILSSEGSDESTQYQGEVTCDSLSADRSYTLPDKTGTIALTSDLSSKQDASTAITTSNISSQSVNYAASAGSVDTASKISCGGSADRVYTMFARTSKDIVYDSVGATLLLSGLGDFGSNVTGLWLVFISTYTRSPRMEVVTMVENTTGGNPLIGYYEDTNYFYFGVYTPNWRRGVSVTVLVNTGVDIQDFGNSTTEPSGFTEANYIGLNVN